VNPGRVFAWLKANPALAVAAAGVGAVLLLPQLRSASGGEGEAESAPAAAGASPYMPVLAGSDLATADIANAIRDGNAVLVNQNSQILDAIRRAQPVPGKITLPGFPSPKPTVPPRTSPPVRPPVTPTKPVPTPKPPAPKPGTKPAPRPSAPKPGTKPKAKTLTYTVRAGDTLSAIATRYGVEGGWPKLYADNRSVVGTNPNLIRPGQRLRVVATKGF
jgi:nucleoid-associated protein YgaU